jgi:hypothetical protein
MICWEIMCTIDTVGSGTSDCCSHIDLIRSEGYNNAKYQLSTRYISASSHSRLRRLPKSREAPRMFFAELKLCIALYPPSQALRADKGTLQHCVAFEASKRRHRRVHNTESFCGD